MRSSFLSKHFPLPKFLKPPHIGVTFSDSVIKAVMFDGPLPNPDLKSIVIPIDKGTIVGGNIANIPEITKKLAIVRESFKSSFVLFTIPDELTYIFSVSIPITKGGNVTESVAFTIEENVPFSLADTVFDFTPFSTVKSESGYQASVVVAACVKREIEKFTEVFHKSGFELVGCVHESQAIANAVIPKDFTGASYIAHSRGDRIGIYLIRNNIVCFSTLRSVLEGDYKKQFLDEYVKFVEYSSKYGTEEDAQTKNIFVCGEFEYAKKTVEALIELGGSTKNAKLSNVWSNVLRIEKNEPSISYEDSLNLAGPIGAILSDII